MTSVQSLKNCLFRFMILAAYSFRPIAAQTFTVTVTIPPTTVTVTQTVTVTATPLTSCEAGFVPLVNGDFETGSIAPWSTGGSTGDYRVQASCGQQEGTGTNPGKCLSVKPLGTGTGLVSQSFANICPGRTYLVTLYVGLPAAAFSLNSGTRLPTVKVDLGGTNAIRLQPVCASSAGIGTNPCTISSFGGKYFFRKLMATVVPASSSSGLLVTVGDTLVANVPVLIDSVSLVLQ